MSGKQKQRAIPLRKETPHATSMGAVMLGKSGKQYSAFPRFSACMRGMSTSNIVKRNLALVLGYQVCLSVSMSTSNTVKRNLALVLGYQVCLSVSFWVQVVCMCVVGVFV